MRVITGSARGLKLKTLEGAHIRPTLDRVKENIFNIISSRVAGERFADIFSGSGALGIEALSRGAASCVFVDDYEESCKVCKENIEKARLSDRATVVKADFRDYFATANTQFDCILVDPPYKKGLIEETCKSVRKHNALDRDGIMVLQFEAELTIDELSGYEIIADRKYGKTRVLLVKLSDETE